MRTGEQGVGEEGSGTVQVLGVIGVLLALALAVSGLIQAQAAAGRARSAADLAALAGAQALSSIFHPADPCETAQRVARSNGAEIEVCEVTGEDVVVSVSVPIHGAGLPGSASARARAGPAGGIGGPSG